MGARSCSTCAHMGLVFDRQSVSITVAPLAGCRNAVQAAPAGKPLLRGVLHSLALQENGGQHHSACSACLEEDTTASGRNNQQPNATSAPVCGHPDCRADRRAVAVAKYSCAVQYQEGLDSRGAGLRVGGDLGAHGRVGVPRDADVVCIGVPLGEGVAGRVRVRHGLPGADAAASCAAGAARNITARTCPSCCAKKKTQRMNLKASGHPCRVP